MTDPRSSDTFKSGDLLNNTYRIEKLLGRGGTSDVYRARSEISGRLVAIKVLQTELSKNESYLRLMTREEAIRDVRHDAVVRYSENQRTAEGLVYLVMDYVDGVGLEEKLMTGGMSADDLIKIAARVLQGLVAAHAKNIVHRDLSPDNIILRNGRPEEAVIIDFGIAKDENPGAETVVGNEFAGKYAYAAPEQLNGKSDTRSDIYSLGALLLSTFRGEPPDVGENPMQLLRLKQAPLNVDGVPEPLKALITKMTAPVPEDRFQSAEDVLRAIDPSYVANHVVQTESPGRRTTPPAAAKSPKKGRGGLFGLLALAAVVVLGLGGYVSGAFQSLLAPDLPSISPFTFEAARKDGVETAKGFAPDEAALTALQARFGEGAVTQAQGTVAPTWGADVLALLDQVSTLPEWSLSVSDDSATLTGLAPDRATRDAVQAAIAGGALTTSVALDLAPRILPLEPALAVLRAHEDCGPLSFGKKPEGNWALGDQIVIRGRLAEQGSRVRVFEAMKEVAGDRDVLIDVEILNQNLCKIEQALPRAEPHGFGVIFGFGDRPDPNPAGRYFVGENPAIDVVIPADVTSGFLWVSIVDVTGSVFHLLPNLNRPDNTVEGLRAGQSGDVVVRVAFGVEEAKGTTKMAFMVDDSVLGKSKVVVLHADSPVFESLRPISESTGSFAAALASEETGDEMAEVFSIDSRILTTEAK
ncbi:serine/threonine protein kinase [Pseudorhodobacter sp. E13]|uniref:serine/threonine protein kinase n=1 Tax=Pseudorhodobacter sp. E13 TaxID=2487931 RepID=UPI000F8E628B|nr:serine/threonine-protein kinase [Pseudorhodobacter sp. E13]RUS59702.1 serine/threonine protein kinase [Pseudorhodobacter sp. E13]